MSTQVEPQKVVQAVDMFVDSQMRDAEKYENRELLDESGIWSLHALAAEIYAIGYEDGTRSADQRHSYEKQRQADRLRRATHQPAEQTETRRDV